MSRICKNIDLGPPYCEIFLKNAENLEIALVLDKIPWWVSSVPITGAGKQKKVEKYKLLRHCHKFGNQDIHIKLNRKFYVFGNLRTRDFLNFEKVVLEFDQGCHELIGKRSQDVSSGARSFLSLKKEELGKCLLVKIRVVEESGKTSAEIGDYKSGSEEVHEAKRSAKLAKEQAEEAVGRADRAEKRGNEMASQLRHLMEQWRPIRVQMSQINTDIEEAKRSAKLAMLQAQKAARRADEAEQRANEMASLIRGVTEELQQLRVEMSEINAVRLNEIQEATRSAKLAIQQAEEAARRADETEQQANEMASLNKGITEELRQLRMQMSEINSGLEGTRQHSPGEHFWKTAVLVYMILLVALLILISSTGFKAENIEGF